MAFSRLSQFYFFAMTLYVNLTFQFAVSYGENIVGYAKGFMKEHNYKKFHTLFKKFVYT